MGLNIQGHRGSRGLRPESTLPAFELALDLMVRTLELDLHLTADEQVVVWHDEALWEQKCRLREGAPDHFEFPIPVRSLSAADLTHFECDKNPEPDRFDVQTTEPTVLAGDDFGLVTLARLVDFVADYVSSSTKTEAQRANAAAVEFNIETKRVEDHPEYIGDDFDGQNPGTFELALLAVIDGAGVTERCTVQSFDFRSLRAIHQIRPEVRLSALSEFVPDFSSLADDGVSIWSPYYLVVSSENVAKAHALGLEVLPWTVNEVEAMKAIVEIGVDGFITDRPDLGMDFA